MLIANVQIALHLGFNTMSGIKQTPMEMLRMLFHFRHPIYHTKKNVYCSVLRFISFVQTKFVFVRVVLVISILVVVYFVLVGGNIKMRCNSE